MKRFLENSGMFFVILFLINLGLYRFATVYYYGEYQRIPDPSFTTFLFADSHGTPLGVTPEEYSVYNFSGGSDSYPDIERKIHWLITSGYNVKTIYLSADPHLMSPYRERRNNLDRSNFFLTPDMAENAYDYLRKRYIEHYAVIFQPKVRQLLRSYGIAITRKILTGKTKVGKDLPWIELTPEQRKHKAESRIHYQYPVEGTSALLGDTVASIARLCRENTINLVGLKFPVSRDYLNALGERGKSTEPVFQKQGIPVLDYSTWYSDKPAVFDNQDHLTAEGAARFTRTLFGAE